MPNPTSDNQKIAYARLLEVATTITKLKKEQREIEGDCLKKIAGVFLLARTYPESSLKKAFLMELSTQLQTKKSHETFDSCIKSVQRNFPSHVYARGTLSSKVYNLVAGLKVLDTFESELQTINSLLPPLFEEQQRIIGPRYSWESMLSKAQKINVHRQFEALSLFPYKDDPKNVSHKEQTHVEFFLSAQHEIWDKKHPQPPSPSVSHALNSTNSEGAQEVRRPLASPRAGCFSVL